MLKMTHPKQLADFQLSILKYFYIFNMNANFIQNMLGVGIILKSTYVMFWWNIKFES